jgi:hypothetical protein
MEHSYIEEHQIADRYVLGKLSVEERMRFEEHFVDCTQCLDRLETAADIRTGLRAVAAEEVSRSRAYFKAAQVGLLFRMARLTRARQAMLLASVVLLLALPTGLLVGEWRSARRNLAEVSQNSADWQRKYEEREAAARNLMKEIQEREAQSSASRDQLAAQLEREREERARLDSQGGAAAGTPDVVPVYGLSIVRSAGAPTSQPVNRINLPSSSKLIVLSLDLEPDPDLKSYRATLSTAEGRTIWNRGSLKPSSEETLALSFNSGMFNSGDYRLTLEGLTAQGSPVHSCRTAVLLFRPDPVNDSPPITSGAVGQSQIEHFKSRNLAMAMLRRLCLGRAYFPITGGIVSEPVPPCY